MKYVLSFLIGLAFGIGAAAAALFYNPLTLATAAEDPDGALVFDYALDPASVLLETHDRALGLPIVPIESPLLWEGGLKGSLLTVLPLDAGNSHGAVATRLTVPSSETELLMAGVIAEDYWLVSVPEAGSFFVEASSNYWPLLRDTAVRIDLLRREWGGPRTYEPTRGPDGGAARVVGLTGVYAEATGLAVDRLALDHYDGRFTSLSGRLTIDLEPAASP